MTVKPETTKKNGRPSKLVWLKPDEQQSRERARNRRKNAVTEEARAKADAEVKAFDGKEADRKAAEAARVPVDALVEMQRLAARKKRTVPVRHPSVVASVERARCHEREAAARVTARKQAVEKAAAIGPVPAVVDFR